MRTTKAILILCMFWLAAVGCEAQTLTVSEVWARPGISGGNSAVYFTVNNPTGEADNLLSADCPIAQSTEIHRSVMKDDGTMSMQPQEGVLIPGGEAVVFQPGGLHVMLVNLSEELNVGETFPLSLSLQHAGDLEVTVTVTEP